MAEWIKADGNLRAAAIGCLGLLLTGCATMTPPDRHPVAATLVGPVWLAEDIGGGGIIDRSHLTLVLDGKGRASGSAGCNHYTGGYRLSGDRLSVTQVASTDKACAPSLMAQETRFINVLGRVTNWRIEPTGALVLLTQHGAALRFFPEEIRQSPP